MNDIVKFQEPRLPYHPAVADRFGIDRGGWKVLTEAIFPAAKSHDSVVMALSYCKARKLDIFKRPVHIVPMWSSARSAMVETVWPGISELRTTAFRTGQYAGIDATEYGLEETRSFKGTTKGRDPQDLEIEVTFPSWAQCTVYRLYDGKPFKFVGPKVYWREEFGRRGGIEVPNEMWAKRPHGQLEKCAEAGALRRAFSEEIGNEYTAEEMEGRAILSEAAAIATAPSPPPAPARMEKLPAVGPNNEAASPAATVVEAAPAQPKDVGRDELAPTSGPQDYAARIADWTHRLGSADRDIQEEIFESEIEPSRERGDIFPPDYNGLMALIKGA